MIFRFPKTKFDIALGLLKFHGFKGVQYAQKDRDYFENNGRLDFLVFIMRKD